MPSKNFSAAVVGLEAQIIEVEVDASYGLRHFEIVGLPDKAVQESKERVGSAIKSSGFQSPHSQPVRVLVALAPADLKKEGALYDLPIALGFLSASKQIKLDPTNKIFVGELSLDGKLRPIKGALAISILAKEKGIKEIILPAPNAAEAGLVQGVDIIGAENLNQVISHIEKQKIIAPFKVNAANNQPRTDSSEMDFSWIKGQEYAKRALEIAAAGSHNILMQGPPGTGKSILAKALPSIMPELSFEESLEVTKIYSVAGALSENNPLILKRPFRSPHHTASEVALIGGGNPPRPGEITLSHRGVLFLDEFPEFHRDALESLRQPMEEGKISILRAKNNMTMPANFTLVAASNPCPCGYFRDAERQCSCTPSQVAMYRRKLSGPLMDRIDLFIDVPRLQYDKLASKESGESAEPIKERVKKARLIQAERFNNENVLVNSEMTIPQIKKYCEVCSKSGELLKKYVDSGRLSGRGYHRVLKTARTIADLDNSDNILFSHVSEALMYRVKES